MRRREARRAVAQSCGDPTPAAHAWSHRSHVLAAWALVLLTAGAFANALPNAFHLDDFYRVVDNPGIQTISPWWRHFVDVHTMATLPTITNYRPLLPLTLSLNYALGGLNPVGYHVVNIALQATAAVLAYWLFLALVEQGTDIDRDLHPWVALTGAAVFAVHPVSGIPVNYVAARDLLLMQVFMTGSLFAYARMRGSGRDTVEGWALVLALYVLAMLSKTGVVVMPGLIVAYEVCVRRARLLSLGPWARAAPFFALAAGFFAFVSLVLHHSEFGVVRGREYTPIVYGATQLKLHLFHYLRNFAWPFPIRQGPHVTAVGPTDPAALAGAAFVLGTLAAAWVARRALPAVTFCILAYWALLVPEASIFPLWALATDYRPYASSPFLYLALATVAASRVPSRRAFASFAAIAVAWSTATTVFLNTTWRTERALWLHSVQYGGSALAHLNLAMTYADPAKRAERLREALRLGPGYILAHMNLGLALIEMGQPVEGLAQCRKAVSIDPGRAQTRYWMAKALEKLGRPGDAALEAAQAARLDPSNVEYAYYAGRTAQAGGDDAGALRRLEPLARRDPPYKDTPFLWGYALQRAGRETEAIAAYRRQLAADPSHVQTLFNLGFSLMEAGGCADATPLFERVLALRPSYAAAHLHLSTCYERTGDAARAAKHRAAWDAASSGNTAPLSAARTPASLPSTPSQGIP